MSEVGVGKSYKPFSVMLRKEDAFKFESSGVTLTAAYTEDSASNAVTTRTTLINNSIEAISGPIEEPPALNSKNKKGQVKKHNVISENYKVLKLAEESEFSYTYSLENYKGLYHTMGGLIEYPYSVTVASASAFSEGEGVYSYGGGASTNYLVGEIDSIDGSVLILKQWKYKEELYLYGNESADTTTDAKLLMIKGSEMFFDPEHTGGLPTFGETAATNYVEGKTSLARVEIVQPRRLKISISSNSGLVVGQTATNGSGTVVITHVTSDTIEAYQTSSANIGTSGNLVGTNLGGKIAVITGVSVISAEIRTLASGDSIVDANADSGADTTVSSIVYRHLIFGHRTPPHYSIAMHYEALDNQYLMTGAVCNEFNLELVSNDVPKGSQSWNVAMVDLDSTKDTEPTNTDTTLYEYTDVNAFTINSVDYSNIFKSISLSVSRDVTPFFGASKTAKGMIQPEIKFNLSCGLLREDRALVDLRLGNTDFTGSITLRRGSALADEVIMHFNSTAVARAGAADGSGTTVDTITPSAGLRLLETPESEDEGKIFHELTFDVTGLPVFEVFDATQYYG